MTLIRMFAFRPHNNEQKKIDSEIKKPSTIENKNPIIKPENQPKEQPKKVEILNKNKIVEPIKDIKKWSEGMIWSDLIKELNLSGLTKMLADNCALIGRKENIIHLSLDEKSVSYKNQEREQILSKSLSGLFNEDLIVKVETSKADSETPSQEKIRQKDEQLETARNSLKSDPDVKEAEDLFGVGMNPESITLKN